jgi:hypothetical protein
MVTRTDIAESVAHLFDDPPVPRAQLLLSTGDGQAPAEIYAVLEQLPEGHYRSLRELWVHLAWVPVA